MFFIKKHISIKQEKYYLNAKFNAKAYAIFKKNCKTSMAVTSHYRILKMFFNINNGLYGEFFLKIKLLVLFQFNTCTNELLLVQIDPWQS